MTYSRELGQQESNQGPRSADIFVDLSEQSEYLQRHGIEYRVLPNGIRLIGAARQVSDSVTTSLAFTFPTGAYTERAGESGITHLLEHLVMNGPGYLQDRYDAKYSATTSSTELRIALEGATHPTIRDYGIWPFIPMAINQVRHPRAPFPEELEREKQVVLDEKYNREPENRPIRLFNGIVYSQENPINTDVLGSDIDISSYTPEKVLRRFQEVFVPEGAIVTLFTQGGAQITTDIFDGLSEQLNLLQQGNTPKYKRIPNSVVTSLNPEFQMGNIYSVDSGFNNGLVTIHYVWMLPSFQFSRQNVAQSDFFQGLRYDFLRVTRDLGLGYTSSLSTMQVGEDRLFSLLSLTIPKNPQVHEIAQAALGELKSKVISAFGADEIQHELDKQKKRNEVYPISLFQRLSQAEHGLKEFGNIIDSDKTRKITQSVTSQDWMDAKEGYFLTNPAIIIIGDQS